MKNRSVIRAILFALLVTLISPIANVTSSQAAGPITKTITVNGSNGSPLAGAQVAIGYADATNLPFGWTFVDTVLTNSSGEATFANLPEGNIEADIYVEPAVNDLTNAIAYVSSKNSAFNLTASGSFTVNLQAASIRVNLKKSDGTASPIRSFISYPEDATYSSWVGTIKLRTGAFGIAIDSSFGCSEWPRFDLVTGSLNPAYSDGASRYQVEITGCPTRTFSVKRGIDQSVMPFASGIWELTTLKRNFRYSAVNPVDNSELQNADVCVVQNNNCSYGMAPSGDVAFPDGTYEFRIGDRGGDYGIAKYTVEIGGSGSTYSVKVGSPASSQDAETLPNGAIKFIPATPNYSGEVTNAAGETFTSLSDSQFFRVELKKLNSYGDWDYYADIQSSGKYAFKIYDAGTYQIQVQPFGINGLSTTRSALITATNSDGIKLSSGSASNVTSITSNTAVLAPNFTGAIKKSNGDSFVLTGSQGFQLMLQKKDENGDFRGIDWQQSAGEFGFVLNQVGVYKVRVEPINIPGFATLYTEEINVTDSGGIVLALGAGVPASTLNSDLLLTSSNLSGTVKDPNGDPLTLTNNQFIDVQLQKKNENGYFEWVDSSGSGISFEFVIDAIGEYRIEATPFGDPNLALARSDSIFATAGVSGIELEFLTFGPAETMTVDVNLATPNVKFNVRNPIDGSAISRGNISVEKFIGESENRNYWGNLNINPSNPGQASGLFENGRYKITVNPSRGSAAIAGLAQQSYYMVVADQVITLETGTVATGQTVTPEVDGSFVISLGKANITGTYVDGNNLPIPSNNTSSANICVQKQRVDGNWDHTSCTNTGSDGKFSLSLREIGTFRLSFEPYGRSDIAASYSATFTLTELNVATYENAYGTVIAAAPTLKLRIREDGRTTNVKFAGIEIRKGDDWIGHAHTGQNGIATVTLTSAGVYQFTANGTDATPESSRKTYTVTAVADNGIITATIAGVEPDSSGISTLTLGTAQLRGTVTDPTGATTFRDSWVVAIDTLNNNQEMWQYGTNTRSDGTWSMSLPAGTYSIYARAPYGNTNYGDSAPLGSVTVNAQGVVALTGAAASLTSAAFNIKLADPYWKGIVKEPTGDIGVPNARVCLNVTIAGVQNWKCANTNSQGNWVMAKPAGFTAFGDNDQLQVAENQNARFSMATFQGSDIEATDFKAAGNPTAVLRLAAPNFSVRVLYGDNLPANRMWVNLNAIAGGWLGGSQTDSNGYAKFRVTDLTKGVEVRIDPNNNPDIAAVTANTMKRYEDADMASKVTGISPTWSFSDTITMSVPNLKAVITDPNNNDATVANSWVEIFDASSNEWKGGSNSNSSGNVSINLPADATYNVKVNPAWNSTSSVATSHTYSIVVDGNGAITSVTDKATNALVTPSQLNGPYSFTLGRPSVTGVVKTPAGETVQNSWVVPTNTNGNIQLWQIGSNSRSNGTFSMAVPNGSYTIQAQAPWGTATYSASSSCAVTIAGGAVTSSSGGCIAQNQSLVLTLRSPNLTVRVTDKDGVALQNAHVGIGLGNWNVNAQTDKNGNAALFIDPVAIGTTNNGKLTGTQNLWMWIDPPYGNSNVVRTQCYSGQANTPCASLAQVTPGSGEFAQATIIAPLPAPNTTINIKRPDGTTSAGANAWVSIMSIIKNESGQETGRNWIAGANTDATGKATFNIVDTSVAFVLQVEAPWNQRGTYAGATYDTATGVFGLTWAAINNQNFSLASPNLTMSALKPSPSSEGINSGWISVEKADISNNPIGWVAGYGLDQNGKASMKLAASGRFKITVNPGPGVGGVSTSCIVTTNGSPSPVVTIVDGQCGSGSMLGTVISLPLATGNVTGTVTANGKPVVGAIVTANTTTSPSDATLQVTSTDELGNYSFELNRSVNWDISITPVNLNTDVVKLAAQTLANQDVPATGQLYADAQLVPVTG
jgi:hypothetical protein